MQNRIKINGHVTAYGSKGRQRGQNHAPIGAEPWAVSQLASGYGAPSDSCMNLTVTAHAGARKTCRGQGRSNACSARRPSCLTIPRHSRPLLAGDDDVFYLFFQKHTHATYPFWLCSFEPGHCHLTNHPGCVESMTHESIRTMNMTDRGTEARKSVP